MNKPTKKVSKPSKFAEGEHIRVVPLHTPKPEYSIDQLTKARKGREESEKSELFDGKAHAAPLNAKLTYRGGALLPNVEVFTIFWGKLWGTSPASSKLITDLNQFFTTILTSTLMDQMKEYSVPKQAIGPGKFTGTKTISANAPAGSISDSAIQRQLKKWIAAGTVPKNNKNTLYFIYLDPGIVSIMGGSQSCKSFCGYHNHKGKVYYAVMPYPSCNGCLGGMPAFDALTGTSSHELCEAITDPVPGAGWYDDKNGEIGDICAWNFKKIAGYTVQLEWSNAQDKCA